MPFKSKAQQRLFFGSKKIPIETAKRWAKETPDIEDLPEKVEKKSMLNPELEEIVDLVKSASEGDSATGIVVPIAPRISPQQVARTTYFNKIMSMMYSPTTDDEMRRRLLGEMKDRVDYGVNSPHVGIPSRGVMGKLKTWMFGGLSIPSELAGKIQDVKKTGV